MNQITQRAKTALEGSIVKWLKITNILEADPKSIHYVERGPQDCPLCQEYLEAQCRGCPILQDTDRTGCQGTPYDKWSDREQADWADGGETPENARAMLNYLTELDDRTITIGEPK